MKRSKYNLSHYHLTTMNMGKLVPVGNFEVLPGDTVQLSSSALVRAAPLVSPVMHPCKVRIHWFFVPYRILWDGWESFITGGSDGMDVQNPPTIDNVAQPEGGLLDFMGVPPLTAVSLNALPVRAYNKIFNEWYRDEDLVPEVDEDSTEVQDIGWEKDYFTTARPWTQKGPEVTLPLGTEADVFVGSTGNNQVGVRSGVGGAMQGLENLDGQLQVYKSGTAIPETGLLKADLADATAVSVDQLRLAFALQRYEEARAQYGSRYTEYLRYLGINPRDSRLDRPEYVTGGVATIAFSEVLQTAVDDAGSSPVGQMYGHGIVALRTRRARMFVPEFGIMMGLMSTRPKTIYKQGMHRKFLRRTKEDYYQQELERIGQQAVYNAEVYAASGAEQTTFGYQDRYAEYRREPSRVSNEFRVQLEYWHLARSFSQAPALNASFVECDPSKRIYADQNASALYCMVSHNVRARRRVTAKTIGRVF